MRKYILNENFFEDIDSEEKAYFLGLLYADGYVNENLCMVDLTLHKQDVEILHKFITCLYINERPLTSIRDKYLRLVINSKKIVCDLKRHGCFQKKTFKLKFPELNENMIRHFIRGYFDGDGSITINKKKMLNISMVGTIDLLQSIKHHFIKNCQLNDVQLDNRHPIRNNNIRALRYGGNIIINRIYHYLYDDSTIFLSRKKDKFLDILKSMKYFYDKNYKRNAYQKYFEFEGELYTKTELSKKLSTILNQKSSTIRRKLQIGWSIDDIIKIPLNKPRPIKLKTVLMINNDNNIVNRYESVEIAAIENVCTCGSIYQAIHKNKRLLKHYWKYE